MTGEIYIVQARPVTVRSRRRVGAVKRYKIGRKGERLLSGFSVGEAAVAGPVFVLESAQDIVKFKALNENSKMIVTEMKSSN